jgi:fluoroacetyl-CoA thioesterase
MPTPAFAPPVGAEGTAEWTVGPEHLAEALGNPGVRVLATPMLLDVMEMAAHHALLPFLPSDWVTLGLSVQLEHLKPTPPGFRVRARAVITEVDRQRVAFSVEVYDDLELVGRGRHERFCLPRATFLDRVRAKIAARSSPGR